LRTLHGAATPYEWGGNEAGTLFHAPRSCQCAAASPELRLRTAPRSGTVCSAKPARGNTEVAPPILLRRGTLRRASPVLHSPLGHHGSCPSTVIKPLVHLLPEGRPPGFAWLRNRPRAPVAVPGEVRPAPA
jgi:hypothetical protein